MMYNGVRGVCRIKNRKWPLSVDLITTISQLFLCLCLRGSLIGRRGIMWSRHCDLIEALGKQNTVCKRSVHSSMSTGACIDSILSTNVLRYLLVQTISKNQHQIECLQQALFMLLCFDDFGCLKKFQKIPYITVCYWRNINMLDICLCMTRFFKKNAL